VTEPQAQTTGETNNVDSPPTTAKTSADPNTTSSVRPAQNKFKANVGAYFGNASRVSFEIVNGLIWPAVAGNLLWTISQIFVTQDQPLLTILALAPFAGWLVGQFGGTALLVTQHRIMSPFQALLEFGASVAVSAYCHGLLVALEANWSSGALWSALTFPIIMFTINVTIAMSKLPLDRNRDRAKAMSVVHVLAFFAVLGWAFDWSFQPRDAFPIARISIIFSITLLAWVIALGKFPDPRQQAKPRA
jgi:hypothetical protein